MGNKSQSSSSIYVLLHFTPFFCRDFDMHSCARVEQSTCKPVSYTLRHDDDFVHRHFAIDSTPLNMVSFCVEERFALAGTNI